MCDSLGVISRGADWGIFKRQRIIFLPLVWPIRNRLFEFIIAKMKSLEFAWAYIGHGRRRLPFVKWWLVKWFEAARTRREWLIKFDPVWTGQKFYWTLSLVTSKWPRIDNHVIITSSNKAWAVRCQWDRQWGLFIGQLSSFMALLQDARTGGQVQIWSIFDRFLIDADFDNFQIVEMWNEKKVSSEFKWKWNRVPLECLHNAPSVIYFQS